MSIAGKIADYVNERPVPAAPIPVELPEIDDPISASLDHLGYAEGQSFAIQYVDSSKRASTRRITVWGLVAGVAGVPSLIAFCHERNAKRQFRVDRIQCFIDYDGEIFDNVPVFLADNFGMALSLAGRSAPEQDSRWSMILKTVKHDAVLLSALSRSDGKTTADEVEIATDFLSRLAEANGIMLDEAEILAIYRYANRLRPTEDAVARALEHVSRIGQRHIQKLLMTASAVIDADGKRHPSEVALINEIAIHLTGVRIA